MACLLTGGIPLQCTDSNGGVSEIYIGAYNGSAMTYTIGTSSNVGKITAFAGVTNSFYTFVTEQQVAEFKEEGAFSPENGTTIYNQTLDMNILKQTAANKAMVDTLGVGRWRIIYKDNNDLYWYVGAKDGLKVTAMAGGSGKAKGDMNGMKVTFSGTEKYEAFEITQAAALSLIA